MVGYLAPVPEILEVERYRAFAEQALDRPITRAWMVDSRYGRGGTTPPRLRAALVGRSFTAARRRGKLLLLDTDGGPTLGVRFGMTGGLVVDGRRGPRPPALRPGRLQREVGAGPHHLRRRGRTSWCTTRAASARSRSHPTRTGSGPTPLTVSLARAARRALAIGPGREGTAAPLKARLMDQERLAGVGNLLADEILWRAGLAPGRRTPLTEDELRELHTVAAGHAAPAGAPGRLAHGRSHGGAQATGGAARSTATELRREVVGGRTTYWCPAHQH